MVGHFYAGGQLRPLQIGDSIMASARVVCSIRSDAANVLIARDQVEQLGQHWCIPSVTAGDLDRSDFQRLCVDTEMDLTPDAPFGAAMLTRIPLALFLDLDTGAVRCPAVAACSDERG